MGQLDPREETIRLLNELAETEDFFALAVKQRFGDRAQDLVDETMELSRECRRTAISLSGHVANGVSADTGPISLS